MRLNCSLRCTRRSVHSNGARRYWVRVLNAQCFDERVATEAARDSTVSRRPPHVFGVEGASPKIHGYVDVPLVIDDVVLHHALFVVENLDFFSSSRAWIFCARTMHCSLPTRPLRSNFRFNHALCAPSGTQVTCPKLVVSHSLRVQYRRP